MAAKVNTEGLKSFAVILAGFFAIAGPLSLLYRALQGFKPGSLTAIGMSVAAEFAAGLLGGYVIGRWAPRSPLMHAGVLAALLSASRYNELFLVERQDAAMWVDVLRFVVIPMALLTGATLGRWLLPRR
jgi:hypothetical protein